MKIELDQTVWVKPIGNNARRNMNTDPIEATVSKIGRKYFELTATDPGRAWTFRGEKFHLDGGCIKTDYAAGYKVYETKQEIEDEHMHGLLSTQLRQFFSYNNNASLVQLLAVAELLGIDQELANQ